MTNAIALLNSGLDWRIVDEDRYYEMLEILPPACQTGLGFLVGEPMDHVKCSVTKKIAPNFTAFAEIGTPANRTYYECTKPLTIAEFRAITENDLP
jgi:hypothetical protein